MARLPLTVGAILLWGVCGAAVATQRSQVDTAVISGSVVTDSGAAVRLAQVSLTTAEGSVRAKTQTDDTGRFTFEGLEAGRYGIGVDKPGYLWAKFGQLRPGTSTAGRLIDVTRGQRVENLVIRISQGGAISGRITDDHGDPVYQATVLARRIGGGVVFPMRTDERGQYRIGLLPPSASQAPSSVELELQARQRAAAAAAAGAQTVTIVTGSPDAVAPRGFLPVFYPSTITPAEATSVHVEYGEQRGIDIVLQSVVSARISGIVSLSDGRRVSRARVYFVEDAPLWVGAIPLVEATTKDGTFAARVPPGRYTVYVRAALEKSDDRAADGFVDGGLFANAASELYGGQADVSVNVTDLSDLALILQPGVRVTGSVSVAGATSSNTPDFSGTFLGLTDVSLVDTVMIAPTPIAIDESGRFSFPSVAPGRYSWKIFGDLRGLWPRSLMVNGRDTLDVPLEVRNGQDITGAVLTLRAQSSEISGALLDTAGHPTSDYTVVLFPSDPDLWVAGSRRIKAMPTGTDGRFSFPNLPGGPYRLAAVVDAEYGAWNTPTFLRTLLGSSTPVLLGEGEKKVHDLRIVR